MNTLFKNQAKVYKEKNKNRGRLLIKCPDQPGIVANISQFLFQHKANIIESSQYSTDHEGGIFFMRIEFECPNLPENYKPMKEAFNQVAQRFQMEWRLQPLSDLKRTAIFVSKQLHCLREILLEWQNGDMMMEIPLVISNHLEGKEIVEALGIPFYHIPASKDNREEVETKQLQLLDKYQIDVVILARYMQILTPRFVSAQANKIINIHHSFLPAFVGAKPYDRAFERGVKIIGATSHYVTNDLDEGPIIEQDISRVDHRDQVEELKRKGASIERSVLARAVKWHLEDRVIVYGNKTVVF